MPATYSAARLWAGLPVLRPSIPSLASACTCDHQRASSARTPMVTVMTAARAANAVTFMKRPPDSLPDRHVEQHQPAFDRFEGEAVSSLGVFTWRRAIIVMEGDSSIP